MLMRSTYRVGDNVRFSRLALKQATASEVTLFTRGVVVPAYSFDQPNTVRVAIRAHNYVLDIRYPEEWIELADDYTYPVSVRTDSDGGDEA